MPLRVSVALPASRRSRHCNSSASLSFATCTVPANSVKRFVTFGAMCPREVVGWPAFVYLPVASIHSLNSPNKPATVRVASGTVGDGASARLPFARKADQLGVARVSLNRSPPAEVVRAAPEPHARLPAGVPRHARKAGVPRGAGSRGALEVIAAHPIAPGSSEAAVSCFFVAVVALDIASGLESDSRLSLSGLRRPAARSGGRAQRAAR